MIRKVASRSPVALKPLVRVSNNLVIVRFPRRKRRRRVGGDELTGVNLGPVDPATLQATKIACGVKTCV